MAIILVSRGTDASRDKRGDGIVGDVETTKHDAVDGWSTIGRESQGISLLEKGDGNGLNKEVKLRSDKRD